jgi:hypothetical protein
MSSQILQDSISIKILLLPPIYHKASVLRSNGPVSFTLENGKLAFIFCLWNKNQWLLQTDFSCYIHHVLCLAYRNKLFCVQNPDWFHEILQQWCKKPTI